MILKIIGVCWMVGPVFIFFVPNSNVGELLPYAATSFIMGFLCFKAAPKPKKVDSNKINSDVINNNKPLNPLNYSMKFKNEDHERFVPKSPKIGSFQSNYSESLKVVENIGNNKFNSNVKVDIDELIRNGKDNPGETSRILTESYFGIGYNGVNKISSMENLISFRAAAYSILDLELGENTIKEMAVDYCNNFPAIILCLAYFEAINIPEKMEFFENNYPLIYKIIEEEHIKVATRLQRVPVVSKISDSELREALKRIIS